MPISMKQSVLAVVPETTEGTPVAPSAATQFTAMQDDFAMNFETETLDNAELRSSLGKAKPTIGTENPSASFSHYMRGSGTEGAAPDYNDIMKALTGAEVVAGTEYDTVSSSTTTAINVDTGEGANFQRGQGLLLKHATAAHEVNVVHSVSGDVLTPAFTLDTAPATSVRLGKCVLWKPADTGHQTLSLWRYDGNGGARRMFSGARVTEMALTAPAGQYVNASFSFEALKMFHNPIEITSSSRYLDWTDSDGTFAAAIAVGWYSSPHEVADALQAAMRAANSGETATVTYSDTTGKFTIKTTNTTLSLLWQSGTNTANTIGTKLGFDVAADDTGTAATTGYTSDNAQTLTSPYTPTLDSSDPVAAKYGVVKIGDSTDSTNFEAANVDITWTDERGVNPSVCAPTGISNSLVVGREVTVSLTALIDQYNSKWFKRFKEGDEIRFMYAWGPRVGGNWVPGKVMYSYLPTLTITSFNIGENNGLATIELEGTAFVNSSGQGEAYFGQL